MVALLQRSRAACSHRRQRPYWLFRFNGFGEFAWKATLTPGASTKGEATWHCFWR